MTARVFRAPVYDALGYRFAISSSDEEVVDTLDELLADMRASDASTSPTVANIEIAELATDDDSKRWYRVAGSDDVHFDQLWEGSMISHTLMLVNRLAAGECERAGDVPIHGGAAALDGHAVVLPGFSGTGKTTLSTALGTRLGWTYIADEVCRLSHHDLTIAPYGKPVALRPTSVELLSDTLPRLRRPASRFEQDERFVPPSELDASAPPRAAVLVAAIVFPKVDVKQPTRIDPASPARALELLTQNTLGTTTPNRTVSAAEQRRRVAAFGVLDRLVRRAPAFELTMSDLDDACELVEGIVG